MGRLQGLGAHAQRVHFILWRCPRGPKNGSHIARPFPVAESGNAVVPAHISCFCLCR